MRRSPLMLIRLRRHFPQCLDQSNSSLSSTMRRASQCLQIWYRLCIRQRKIINSLFGTHSSDLWVLLLCLKCMSLIGLGGMALVVTIETILVVSGRSFVSLEETSTRARAFLSLIATCIVSNWKGLCMALSSRGECGTTDWVSTLCKKVTPIVMIVHVSSSKDPLQDFASYRCMSMI